MAKNNIDVRVCFKKIGRRTQSSRQVLLVTVQIGQELPAGAPHTPVDRVVHPLVFLDENFRPAILGKPIKRSVIRPGILHDMLDRHVLIRHRGQAKLEPGRTAEAGRDDGKCIGQNNV